MEKRSDVYSAIDLGTNACRLTIAANVDGRVRILDTFSRITQFGENLHTTGVLSQKAMERGIKTLKECAKRIEQYEIKKSLYVATQACRSAKNAPEFIRLVKEETGLDLKIISAEREIYFSTMACIDIMDSKYKYGIVFDIGGGSTEISWFENRYHSKNIDMIDFISVPYGFITIADPDDNKIKEAKRQFIHQEILKFFNKNEIFKHISKCDVQMIGVSGTINSLVNILLKSETYYGQLVHGFLLRVEDLNRMLDHLLNICITEDEDIHFVANQKQKYLVDSAIILRTIHSIFYLPIAAADRGVRDGIITYLIRDKR
ncbi:Ppx/GppA phosphatase family protein [Candidatus Gromoviella agglomerans]|uniref:Ppx/GppA phosphatase family protein n=1 Tax=Candidatus Gromoviella agglomerans TaxID=2806609 RepID=UPI001E544185|nr:hypothetical protein [Candidatus Gromoviella agglomerans]UFX98479.1 Ppx/GppA family phosphatase [Candidatus Gromoviella agglomerans]